MDIRFFITDVFTQQLFNGAQIAVVPDAAQLNDQQMQAIACEFNQSETVFIHKEDNAAYAVRVFSAQEELGFGSHTALAAAFILQETLLDDNAADALNLRFGDLALAVKIQQRDGRFESVSMELQSQAELDDYAPATKELAKMLGLEAQDIGHQDCQPLLVSNNGLYVVVPISSLEKTRDACFDINAWQESQAPATLAETVLLFTSETESDSADYHLRLLGPNISIHDDPPVGASIPAFSAYLAHQSHLLNADKSFQAERGLQSRRQSLLNVILDAEQIPLPLQQRCELNLTVGGQAVMAGQGLLSVPD